MTALVPTLDRCAYVALLGVLYMLLPQPAHAQRLKFDHITPENGLIQSSVSCITQDRQGFMWFGTWAGLCRYDGYRFKNFQFNPEDSTSLSDGWTFLLTQDSRSRMWVCTRQGVSCFDPETERFERFMHNSARTNSISDDIAAALLEDRRGQIWLGTFAGLDRYRPERKRFDHFLIDPTHPKDPNRNQVNQLLLDHSGMLWVGTPRGVWRVPFSDLIDAKPERPPTFERYYYSCRDSVLLNAAGVTALRETRDGTLWIGTFFGLVSLGKDRRTCTTYRHDPLDPLSLSVDRVETLFEDNAGTLWIGTWGGGINRFRRAFGDFIVDRHIDDDENSLSDDIVLSIFEDKSGLIWVGTRRGLNKLNPNKAAFTVFTHHPSSRLSLSSNDAWSVLEDRRGDLWVGTYWAGLNRIRRDVRTSTVFRFERNDPRTIASDMIYAIHEARDGTLWFGSNAGLERYQRETESFLHIRGIPGELVAIEEDRDGTLWLATHGRGLYHYDPRIGNSVRHTTRPRWSYRLSDLRVLSLLIDHDGSLWVGTARGLNKYNRTTGSITTYQSHPGDVKALSHDVILCLHEDHAGILWIGTDGGGLNRFDRQTNSFRHYDTRDGLTASVISQILEDRQGTLWISTTRGIVRYNRLQDNFEQLDLHDGLDVFEFNRSAGCVTSEGEPAFGGTKGVQLFQPSSFQSNRHPPDVVFTGLSVMNRSANLRDPQSPLRIPINLTRKLTLPYDRNTVTIDFAALDFAASERNHYICKLEGFDAEWISLGTRNSKTYTNLEPGQYRFHVRAANNDGVWNHHGASLHILINPPFWKTRWAIAFYVLTGAVVFFFVRKYELQRLRLKDELYLRQIENQKYAEVTRLKDQFFANISHEFRTPLTLILGPLEQLQRRTNDGEQHEVLAMAMRNASRLLHLINMILDLTKLEAHEMMLHAQPLDLVACVRRSVSMFESLTRSCGIDMVLGPAPDELIAVFDQDLMDSALTNLLSNACKYTPAGGRITVSVSLLDSGHSKLPGWVGIRVHDTGAGIPADHLPHIFERYYRVEQTEFSDVIGTGIGLTLTKEIVELHSGVIEVESKVDEGSTFTILLPRGSIGNTIADLHSGDNVRVEESLPAGGMKSAGTTEPSRDAEAPIVLVIEDNSELRAYMRRTLESEYLVYEAEHGAAGLEKAFSSIPDLIISDVMMPGLDGRQLTNRLKSDERTSHIPVILLTAQASQEHKIEGLRSGADDYIVKPFHTMELLARVGTLLENRRRLREKWATQVTLKPMPVRAAVSAVDRLFLERMIAIVEEHMEDLEFDVPVFVARCGMSESQVRRKLRALTDQTPAIFIRTLRLKRAARYLLEGQGSVTEIAYRVGFNNLSYFSKSFQECFHTLPSEYGKS